MAALNAEFTERLRLTSTLARGKDPVTGEKKEPTERQKEMKEQLETVMSSDTWLRSLKVHARIASRHGLQGPWNRMEAILHCLRIGGAGTVLPKSEWEKLGRPVKPDSDGFPVWVPSISKREEGTGEFDENGDEQTEIVTKKYINLGGHNGKARYYDITETEGPDDWSMEWAGQVKATRGVSQDADEQFLTDMREAIERAGCTLEEKPASRMLATEIGHLKPWRNHIVIRDDMEPAAKAATIAHELAHRFDPFLEKFGDDQFARSEAYERCRDECEYVAESVAYGVCSQYGVETVGTSTQYLFNWYPKRAGQAKNLYERCNKAMDLVLGAASEDQRARWQEAA